MKKSVLSGVVVCAPLLGAFAPAVAFDPLSGEFVVVWNGDDNTLFEPGEQVTTISAPPTGGGTGYTPRDPDTHLDG